MIWRLLLVFMFGMSLSASATQPTSAQRLADLVDADDQFAGKSNPELSTLQGDHRFSREWINYTRPAYDARRQHAEKMLAGLQQIDVNDLTNEQALQLELARRRHQVTVDAARFGEYYLPIDQMRGAHLRIPEVIAAMPRRSLQDFESILTRIDALPGLLEQWETVMRAGLKLGITPPRAAIGELPGQVLGQLAGAEPLGSPLMSPLSQRPDSIEPEEWTAIRVRAEQVLTKSVRPAYDRFARFLKDEYIPNARSTNGYRDLPNGDAWYELELRRHTTMTLSPKKVHQDSLERVRRINARMADLRRELKYEGDAKQFRESLDQEAHQYDSVEAMLRDYRDIAKRADALLPRYFRVLPRAPYGIEPTPAFRGAAAASYQAPPRDGLRAGIVFTGAPLSANKKWRSASLMLHEGVPGHHLERALDIEREAAGGPRRPRQTAFIEGWAMYAEGLGENMGFYTDPYVRYGNLIGEMIEATGSAIDTGLHSQGWSREQAIAFRQVNVGGQQAAYAVNRLSVWPGQILSYGMGADVIRDLKREVSAKLGSRFDIREFHDVVLRDGPLPLDLLQQRVRSYYTAK
jgi:uncharacterized protein (DUF885 family)